MSRARPVVVALAVVMSLLVVAAQPAAASHGLATASIHTTDTDFNSANLINMTVAGSGASATVNYTSVGSYNVVSESGDGSTDGIEVFVGDSFGDAVIHAEVKTVPTASITVESITVDLGSTIGSDYGFVVDVYAVQEEPDGSYGEGTLIENNWNPDFSSGTQTIQLDSSFSVSSGETWTIEFVTQSTDNDGQDDLLQINFDNSFISTWYTWDGNNRDYGADLTLASSSGGFPSGDYIGQNHTAEDTELSFFNVTENTNATATLRTEAWNGTGWETLAEQTGVTTTGIHTLTYSPTGFDTVRNVVEVENASGNGVATFALADEGVQFSANDTFVDNSSASPTGDLQTATPTLEIDVSDTDFVLAQGDTATIQFSTSQEGVVGTDTLTSNGTASYTLTDAEAFEGGDHTWNVTVTDEYGHSVTSQEFSISTPGNISIRNVTEPHAIIDSATAEVVLAGSGETVAEQTVTNGNISLTGLPTDESYIVIVDADGYYIRTGVVTDVFQQSSIFLLNDTYPSVNTTFDIDDPTGTLEEPLLLVQKSINRSQYDASSTGTYQWTTVGGSRLSAVDTMTIILERDALYRLVIRDQDSVRVLGEHQATTAGTFTLVPAAPTLNDSDPGTDIKYDITKTDDSILIEFEDPTNETSSLTVSIHERGNESNQLQPDTTYTNLGDLLVEEPLSAAEQNTSWVVVLNYTRDSTVYEVEQILEGPAFDSVPVELDPMWQQIGTVAALMLFAGVFSVHTRGIGAFAVAGMGAVLYYVGWLDGVASGAAVSVALGIGVIALLATGGEA